MESCVNPRLTEPFFCNTTIEGGAYQPPPPLVFQNESLNDAYFGTNGQLRVSFKH